MKKLLFLTAGLIAVSAYAMAQDTETRVMPEYARMERKSGISERCADRNLGWRSYEGWQRCRTTHQVPA